MITASSSGTAKTTLPTLVLADEPTAALDSKSGRDVVSLMQSLGKEQGCTILLVTYNKRIVHGRWQTSPRCR